MAGGFWRGQAAERNIFRSLLQEYLAGIGPQTGRVQRQLAATTEPLLRDILGKYGHQAASLGQVVPGEGFSTAAQAGERDIIARYLAELSTTALQAATMPWQAKFGAVPGIAQQYAGARQTGGFGGLLATLGGQIVGSAAGGFGGGVGRYFAGMLR